MNAGGSIRHRDWSGDHLGDDASSQEGPYGPVATAVNASAVGRYSVPTRATAITSVIARRPPAERPARPPARRAGAPRPRTKATSAARGKSLGATPGGRAIPGIGAGLDVSALRYKISQRRNPLIL